LKDFKKYYTIPATPEEVYLALTTEITLQLWTGDIASFDPTPGTEFTLWDGSIIGKNLEFEPGKKIDNSDIISLRPIPDDGISASNFLNLIGQTAKRKIKAGMPFSLEDL
jgi:activator of HSP90 ATPase